MDTPIRLRDLIRVWERGIYKEPLEQALKRLFLFLDDAGKTKTRYGSQVYCLFDVRYKKEIKEAVRKDLNRLISQFGPNTSVDEVIRRLNMEQLSLKLGMPTTSFAPSADAPPTGGASAGGKSNHKPEKGGKTGKLDDMGFAPPAEESAKSSDSENEKARRPCLEKGSDCLASKVPETFHEAPNSEKLERPAGQGDAAADEATAGEMGTPRDQSARAEFDNGADTNGGSVPAQEFSTGGGAETRKADAPTQSAAESRSGGDGSDNSTDLDAVEAGHGDAGSPDADTDFNTTTTDESDSSDSSSASSASVLSMQMQEAEAFESLVGRLERHDQDGHHDQDGQDGNHNNGRNGSPDMATTSYGGSYLNLDDIAVIGGSRTDGSGKKDADKVIYALERIVERACGINGRVSRRWNATRLVSEIQSRRYAIHRARKRDHEIRDLVIAVDESGSCAHTVDATYAAALTIAIRMGRRASVIVHSNGFCIHIPEGAPCASWLRREIDRRSKKLERGYFAVSQQVASNEIWEAIADHQPGLVLGIGDLDAHDQFDLLSRRGVRVLLLSHYPPTGPVGYDVIPNVVDLSTAARGLTKFICDRAATTRLTL